MNVLIINLTRFGDLIQTQPVISGFHKQGNRVGLVCVDNFAAATVLLRDLDAVHPFSGGRLLSLLDNNWRESVLEITRFRDSILSSFAPDMVVNLTPSIPARLLARSFGSSQLRGFCLDQHGFNADTNFWAAFLQVAGSNRGSSPFNICDLFLRTAGLHDGGTGVRLASPLPETRETASELLSTSETAFEGFVALQPGASEERRRWPVERFAAVADVLWQKHHLIPVVLGTQSESGLGEKLEILTDCPMINLQGKTSLPELAAVLTECRFLITNDTGTMHLAAGMGTPSISIFLATAQPWDTGPYRAGSIALEPDMECHPCAFGRSCQREEACRTAVSVNAVISAAQRLLGIHTKSSGEARVWLSRFDEQGFLTQQSLSRHGGADRTGWIELQRLFYRRFLDDDSLEPLEVGNIGMSKEFVDSLRSTLSGAKDYLFLMQQQAMVLSQNPRDSLKRKFMASWQQLQNILKENRSFDVLSSLWLFESQQQGRDFAALRHVIDRYAALFSAMHAVL